MSVLLAIIGLMIVVVAGVGLILISLELARLVFGFVSVWWGKLLSFLTALSVVYGLALKAGKHLLDADLPPE